VRDQVFLQPLKTTDKIIGLYSLIFRILGSLWKHEGF
jgi:hypothetical protein